MNNFSAERSRPFPTFITFQLKQPRRDSRKFFHNLREELCDIALNENEEDDNGQDVGNIEAKSLCRELYALTGVSFLDEVLPTPTAFACAEEKVYAGAEGKNIVGNNEVLKVEDCASRPRAGSCSKY